MSENDRPLHGRMVLLAQGEPFQSEYIAMSLRGAGATVIGPARNTEELTSLLGKLRDVPSAAVIDAQLLDPTSRALLDQAGGVGMVVVSTASRGSLGDADFVAPFGGFQIVEAVAGRLAQAA